MYGLRKKVSALLMAVLMLTAAGYVSAQDSLRMEMLDGLESLDAFSDVASFGNYALVASSTSGLLVVSGVEEPDPGVVAQAGEDLEDVRMVRVQGNRVLTGGDDYTLYDFTNPLSPVQLGRSDARHDPYPTDPRCDNVIWQDNLLITWQTGIKVFELFVDASREHLSTFYVVDHNDFTGWIGDVVLWNDLLFISYYRPEAENDLFVWDISNPEEPEERFIPEELEFEGFALDMAVQDGILVITHGSTISVLDVNPSESAEVLGSWSFQEDRLLRYPVMLDDHVIVRSWNPYVVLSLEIDEDYQVTLADSVQMTYGGHGGYCLQGDLLVLAAGLEGLVTLDISDPENLEEPDQWDQVVRYSSGARIGTSLLIDNMESGLLVFDDDLAYELPLTDDLLPEGQVLGSIMSSEEDFAVLSWWNGEGGEGQGIYSYQILTPDPDDQSQPLLRGTLTTAGWIFSNPYDDFLYAAVGDFGDISMEIHDISNLDNPECEQTIEMPNVRNVTHLQCYLGYLYVELVEDTAAKIYCYSLENPSLPELVSSMNLGWFFRVVYEPVFGDSMMFLSADSGFEIYSLEDPEYPFLLTTAGDSLFQYSVLDYNDGNILTVKRPRFNGLENTLEVYNLSDLESPELIAWYPLPKHHQWTYLDSNRVVATWGKGIGLLGWGEINTVNAEIEALPMKPVMQVFPNPANPDALVTLDLPVAGKVVVGVYDLLGREVAMLANGEYSSGRHAFRLAGSSVSSSGIYFIRAESGGWQRTREFVMIK